MKIPHVQTRVLSTPADNPLTAGLPAPPEAREFVALEYMPWALRFEETPTIEGGQLVVPKKPGLGLAFDAAALKHYQVA
jgi:L-alanine-DL-glutamate epimerase-like enolase superfamily enzyme